MTPEQQREIESLTRAGKLIDAIKMYKAATGLGLAESKAAVDAIASGRNMPVPGTKDAASQQAPISGGTAILMERVRQLISEGKKIDAIRIYREVHGGGLKDSKDAVDAIEKGMGPGVQVKSGVQKHGCLGLLILGVGLLAGFVLSRGS